MKRIKTESDDLLKKSNGSVYMKISFPLDGEVGAGLKPAPTVGVFFMLRCARAGHGGLFSECYSRLIDQKGVFPDLSLLCHGMGLFQRHGRCVLFMERGGFVGPSGGQTRLFLLERYQGEPPDQWRQ